MPSDNNVKFKNWLKTVQFLEEKDCELFADKLRNYNYSKDEFFLKEGQVCNMLGFVCSGSFRVYYLNDGKEINTQFIFENQFVVDYNSFLDNRSSRYYIQAMEESEIVCFDFETLNNAYRLSHNWERFGRIMAEYSSKEIARRVENFLFLNGEQRYLSLLENEPEILNRVPLYHVASYLGLERESLSRLRRKISTKN